MPPFRSTLLQAALVTVLTVALYAPGLSLSPPHLTHDEIKFALQAEAIADTGRDLNGRLFPLYFKEAGFAVGRDPMCIYVMAAFLKALPLSEQSIRLSTVLAGAAGVGLMFLLARLTLAKRSVAWIAALIMALTPAYYIHSRLALSVVYPVPMTVLWLIAVMLYLRTQRTRDAVVIGLVLGAGIYSYLAAAIMMPLYLGATLVVLWWRGDRRGCRTMLLAFGAMMVPLLAWQLIEPDRYSNILSAYRLYDHDTSAGGGLLQRLASVQGLVSRVDVLWDSFNPGRLFFTGESSLQISTRQVGSFLTPVAVFLLVGIVTLSRRPMALGSGLGPLVLFGLFTSPLPGVIMADVEIRRWLVVVPLVAIVAALGAGRLLEKGWRTRVAAIVLTALMPLQFAFFARDYFGPYRERSSVWFGGNIRAALNTVLDDARLRAPASVYLANEIPWVEAYWRFYSKVRGVDLGDRTHYIQLGAGEIPRAEDAAVMVTPADTSLSTQLAAAGWTSQRVIADLDGRPSLIVATRPAP
jgi:4-amino-4-deoxy-L-arabinose transferase-like glycosyltransferase